MSGRDRVESLAAFGWNHRPESMEYAFRGGSSTTTLLGIVVLVNLVMISAIVHHAWSSDYQPQGRYMLPAIGMIAVLLHHSHRFIPQSLFNTLFGSMYLLSVYSFISIGLNEVEKYCG